MLAKLALLGTTLIAVRALPAHRFGQFIALSAAAFLAAWFWDAGITSVITRELAARRITVRGAIPQAVRLRLMALPLWLLTLVVGFVFVDRDHGLSWTVMATIAAASAIFSFHAITLAILRAQLRFAAAGLASVVGRLFTATASLAALPSAAIGHPLETLALAFAGGEAITLVISAAAVIQSRGVRLPSPKHERSLLTLRAALPFNANNLLMTTYNRFDVVIISALSSVTQLGLYAPASRIQDALFLLPSSLGLIAFPLVSSASAQGRTDEIRRLVRSLILIGLGLAIPAAIAMTLLTPSILNLVLGPRYAGAATATRILSWSLPFAVIETPLLAALMGSGFARETTRVYAGAFLVAIGMHLSLDWWWGATGGAVASLCREPAALIILLALVKRSGILRASPPRAPRAFVPKKART